ncbi:MAG: MBL fold metallo-hydrolase [Anaerolineae bacterium]|nr:MBL fold metallo-hydrolase [Anaerolineae bacterium]
MHPFNELSVPVGKIGIHWFGQNSFALKDPEGTVLLVDPFFPHDRPAERFIYRQPPLDEAELKTDLVLLTHDHGDHTCIESLTRVRVSYPDARFIGPVESIKRMTDAGFPQEVLITATAGSSIQLGTIAVHTVWSKPPEGAPEDGIRPPDVQHLGLVIVLGGVRVYITGDMINTFADHDELVAPVAALKPEIGLLTMHPTEGEFPYFDGAVKLAVGLGLKAAVPAHYACFVKRTYDPCAWAKLLPEDGPEAIIIPYDGSVLYPSGS